MAAKLSHWDVVGRVIKNPVTVLSIIFGSISFFFGFWLVLDGDTYQSTSYRALAQATFHHEWLGGAIFMAVGAFVVATPWLGFRTRVLGRAAGATAFSFLALMFSISNYSSTAVPTYTISGLVCFGLLIHALVAPYAKALDRNL